MQRWRKVRSEKCKDAESKESKESDERAKATMGDEEMRRMNERETIDRGSGDGMVRADIERAMSVTVVWKDWSALALALAVGWAGLGLQM